MHTRLHTFQNIYVVYIATLTKVVIIDVPLRNHVLRQSLTLWKLFRHHGDDSIMLHLQNKTLIGG